MLSDLLVPWLVPQLAQFFLWLASFMAGNLVIYGDHAGRLAWDSRFESPIRLFGWLVLGVIVGLTATELLSPLVEGVLFSFVDMIMGVTSAALGTFYVWFIYAGDYDITTDNKWIPAAVFFSIFALNVIIVYYLGVTKLPF